MLRNGPVESLCLAAFVLVIAAIALWGVAGLPQPRWEPLGPASLPRAIAVSLIVLSAFAVVWSFIRSRAGDAEKTKAEGDITQPDQGGVQKQFVIQTIAFISICLLGVSAMSLGWLGYRPIAFAISIGGVFVLNGFRLPLLIPLLILALSMSFGVHFVMTQLLSVPLR